MTTGGMAERGLLKYGDKALLPVLEELKNPNETVRTAALETSIALLETHGDDISKKRMRDLIWSSLKDPASAVRRHAVREIDCLSDRQDFVSVLSEIAKSDPERLPGKSLDGGDGDAFYPVRYDARTVLRDIQNNKKCNE
jgi:hypothetical protein